MQVIVVGVLIGEQSKTFLPVDEHLKDGEVHADGDSRDEDQRFYIHPS